MKVKWRNIALLLVIVGQVAAGVVLLLGKETALARVLRISEALDGSRDQRRPTASTPTPSSMTIPTGEPLIVDGISWFATRETTPTPGPEIRIASPRREAAVTANQVNLRAGPSVEHRIVDQAARGDRLEILGRSQAGDWLKVAIPEDAEAWVHGDLVSTDVWLEEVPVVEAPAPIPPTR